MTQEMLALAGLVAAGPCLVAIGFLIGQHGLTVSRMATEILAKELAGAQELLKEIPALRDAAANEERRRVEVVEVIGQIEKERNDWRQKYTDAALGHSVAQQMLMRELERISRLAISKGITRAELSTACRQVVSEYAERHREAIPAPSEPQRIAGGSAVAEVVSPKVDSAVT